MTDKRLLCAAAMVRDGAHLADVGTDHAYLPVYLVQSGRVKRAIAADIGEGPAASARRHIADAGLTEAVEVRVCDGLTGIAPDEVTDIVIAGMGGETIIHILSDAPWVCCEGVRLILQPMTKTVELRRWLYQNGFAIVEEHLVPDGRHRYIVMAATYTGVSPDGGDLLPYLGDFAPYAKELAAYVGALGIEEGQDYFVQQETALERRIRGLECTGRTEEAQAMLPLLQALRTYRTNKKKGETL